MDRKGENPQYEILEECGRGGMGVVYRARDRRLNRIVALKFLGAEGQRGPEGMARFHREAEAIAALNHPAVSTIFEAGEWDGDPFLALEFLSGGTLKQRIPPGGMSEQLLMEYAGQLGSGLAYAHEKGILHRDVKPGNCMFSAHGALKLVDFGLAKAVDGEEITRAGTTLGTVPYMAPELLLGEPASVGSDLYALGAVVYEMAAGRPMYSRQEGRPLREQVLKGAAAPLSDLRPDLPPAFCAAVRKATAILAEDRFTSIERFLQALRHKEAATETIITESGTKAPTRSQTRQAVYVLAITAIVLSGIGFWVRGRGSTSAEVVVVLPFENLGGDAANQPLCDGLQETVTSILSSSAELRRKVLVVPSSEVRRGQIKTITEARNRFSATLALTGSTQRSEKDLHVTLALSDAREMRQKDSRVLVVPASGSVGLQRQLAASLGELLGAGRIGMRAGETTASSVAYDLFLQGRGALEDRNFGNAITLLKKSLDADPKFTLARAKLAEAYLRNYLATKEPKWLAMADEQAAEAARGGETPEVMMARALIQKTTGNFPEAIDSFRRVLENDPANVEAIRFLADTLNSAGRLDEAEATYRQGLRLRPGYWPLFQSLGDFYAEHRKYTEAEQAFTTGLSLAAETPSLYYNMGAMYFRMNRWEDAGKAFEKSLAVRPTPVGYSNLGTVRFYEGKYEESAKQMEKATAMQPASAVNWGNLGDALWQLNGRRDEARAAFERGAQLAKTQLAINPENVVLRKCYAVYLAKLGRSGEAVNEARRAMTQGPQDGSVHYWAARAFEVTGDEPAALAAIEKSIALGYSGKEISREPDFEHLRSNARYQELIAAAKVAGN